VVIQMYPEEVEYVRLKMLQDHQPQGSFLWSFFDACLRADDENYEYLRPTLRLFMVKYPAGV
jgi:hypothetical protein